MAERKRLKADPTELFRPRKFRELNQPDQRHFLESLGLVQANLGEIRDLGYVGPEPASFDPQRGYLSEPDKTVVMFSFPQLIPGGLAGTERGGFSIWIASLTFPVRPVAETASITAHELLHTSLHGFHPDWDQYRGDSRIDQRLKLIFGTKED